MCRLRRGTRERAALGSDVLAPSTGSVRFGHDGWDVRGRFFGAKGVSLRWIANIGDGAEQNGTAC